MQTDGYGSACMDASENIKKEKKMGAEKTKKVNITVRMRRKWRETHF
jgi:hypothetical protein